MVNLNFVVIAGEILVLHTKFNPMKKKVLVPAAPIVMNAVSFLHPPIDNFMLTTRSCSPLSILPRDCLNLFATIQVKSSKSVLDENGSNGNPTMRLMIQPLFWR